MKPGVIATFVFLFAALIWEAMTIVKLENIAYDQRVYIEAGCHGRYQGVE